MAKCEMCGKGPHFGHNVSHSEHRTKRRFNPNVQRMRVTVEGKRRRMWICTRCLRTMNKAT